MCARTPGSTRSFSLETFSNRFSRARNYDSENVDPDECNRHAIADENRLPTRTMVAYLLHLNQIGGTALGRDEKTMFTHFYEYLIKLHISPSMSGPCSRRSADMANVTNGSLRI
jgi:hypothetical protein